MAITLPLYRVGRVGSQWPLTHKIQNGLVVVALAPASVLTKEGRQMIAWNLHVFRSGMFLVVAVLLGPMHHRLGTDRITTLHALFSKKSSYV